MTTAVKTHVQQRVLQMNLEVAAGSDTRITIGIPDCGGFLAAYGPQGSQQLKSLQNTVARSVEEWFDNHQTDFTISSGQQYR